VSIGTGIVLFVIGAILSFAVNVQVSWVDLHLVGYILMGAGVVVFLIGIIFLMRRRATTSTTRTVDSSGREQVTNQRTEHDDPGVY
jgi:nitrate reductase gamma subunit